MSSWHTLACARKIARHVRAWQCSFCQQGFDMTGWHKCKWSFPAPFFFFFFLGLIHESQKLTGESCLSIHGSKTGCLVHLWVDWWTGDWWIFITDLAEYMQTNRQGQNQHVWYLGSLVKMGICLFGSTSTTFASQCVHFNILVLSNSTETVAWKRMEFTSIF